jgi:hypothetical protein
MIFIGAELSDPYAHFVTNIVACVGTGNNLMIDLLKAQSSEDIFDQIEAHIQVHDETCVIYNPYTVEDFFISFKNRFPELRLIIVFSDDEWRHTNYDRYLALYSDVFTIAVKDNLKAYQSYGLDPFYMQWACNPEMFHPLPEQRKDIDVSFIGVAYGQRIEYIKFLIANGIKVKVFGKGWDRHSDTRSFWGGYISQKEMLEVIARSKINLNFLWTSVEKERCTIKARTLELSACRAFQLSNHTNEFSNYGFVDGKNIAVYDDQQDALKQVCYYLKHDKERESIAQQAYDHVLQYHTWEQRFQKIFERIDKRTVPTVSVCHKLKVIVLVRQEIKHQICADDERLEISFVEPENNWQKTAGGANGVIYLDRDSKLNNETLYMMLFGLMADKSDIITANFYTGGSENCYWIRIIDRMVEKNRALLHMLPAVCMMFSGKYASKYGCKLVPALCKQKVSYIEHPSFWIKLPYYLARKLRLYFAYHGDSRQNFKAYLSSFKFGKAWSLCIDKIWQKIMQNRLGV